MRRVVHVALVLAVCTLPACSSARGASAGARVGHGSGPITDVRMLTPLAGWGFGPGRVARTGDGAVTFVDVTPPDAQGGRMVASAVLDQLHAWVVTGGIDRTVDGGATWQHLAFSGRIDSLTFMDPLHGWLEQSAGTSDHRATVTTMMRTIDGGVSWTTVYRYMARVPIEPNVQVGDCTLSTPSFTTPLDGFAGVDCPTGQTAYIDVTSDGGSTWSHRSLPPVPAPAGMRFGFDTSSPVFFSPENGAVFAAVCVGTQTGPYYSCQEFGALFLTDNGGTTWRAGAMIGMGIGAPSIDSMDIAWVPHGCTTACGTSSPPAFVLRSVDGGAHWTELPLPDFLGPNLYEGRTLMFQSAMDGLAIDDAPSGNAQWYRTADGARTFVPFTPRIIGS